MSLAGVAVLFFAFALNAVGCGLPELAAEVVLFLLLGFCSVASARWVPSYRGGMKEASGGLREGLAANERCFAQR